MNKVDKDIFVSAYVILTQIVNSMFPISVSHRSFRKISFSSLKSFYAVSSIAISRYLASMFHIPALSLLEHASSCRSGFPRTAWYTLLISVRRAWVIENVRILIDSLMRSLHESSRQSVFHFFRKSLQFLKEHHVRVSQQLKIPEATRRIRKKIEAHMKHFELMNSKRRSKMKWRNDGLVNRFGQSHQNREK